MRQALYMMRVLIALQLYRELEEALFHAFECPDKDDDRFETDSLDDRMNQHRRIITLTGANAS